LAILAEVRERFGVPVLTDIRESHQVVAAAQAVDVLQIPALLCRQPDLLEAADKAVAGTATVVNVKKASSWPPGIWPR
jgi:2-dehydro-3-deoxyphosphooctonate aldolase (KDO 8-P synthase)